MFFSWFTNMAMHVGMGDLSVLRYARKARYGLATATGMYLGHFLAWIAASMLYALQVTSRSVEHGRASRPVGGRRLRHRRPAVRDHRVMDDRESHDLPCGARLPGDRPDGVAIRVTFLTGLACTIAGMFPAIAMQLLGFVALYGLALMPMGAVIFCDYWLMRRAGMRPFYAEVSGRGVNWAPAIAWLVTLAVCLAAVWQGYIEIYSRACLAGSSRPSSILP